MATLVRSQVESVARPPYAARDDAPQAGRHHGDALLDAARVDDEPTTAFIAESDEDRIVASRVHDWRGWLIDLTYRNRLIRYNTHQKVSNSAITAPDIGAILADPERARPWRFYLPPEEDGGRR